MSLQQAQITVHPPLTQKKLTRYLKKKGTYVIRDNKGKVLYIGYSKNLYDTICRLFQGNGILKEYDSRKMHFEIIFTTLRVPCIKSILQRHFKPAYNSRIQPIERLNDCQKRQAKRILEAYLQQSRFTPLKEVQGDHQTDLEPLPKTQ